MKRKLSFNIIKVHSNHFYSKFLSKEYAIDLSIESNAITIIFLTNSNRVYKNNIYKKNILDYLIHKHMIKTPFYLSDNNDIYFKILKNQNNNGNSIFEVGIVGIHHFGKFNKYTKEIDSNVYKDLNKFLIRLFTKLLINDFKTTNKEV